MSENGEWGIRHSTLEIRTALGDFYGELVGDEELFLNRYSLFAAGLAYGLLYDRKHDVKPTTSFVKLPSIKDEVVLDVLDFVYRVLDDGRDRHKVWSQMLSIADGGVKELYEIYKGNGNFRIPHLVKEAESLWPTRAKELHNINLSE